MFVIVIDPVISRVVAGTRGNTITTPITITSNEHEHEHERLRPFCRAQIIESRGGSRYSRRTMLLPALRNLDVSPVEHEGQTLICFRDPEGFVEEQVVLTPLAFFVASYLDGTTSVLDIQHAFAREFDGALLMSDNVLKVVQYLDDQGFLLTDRFESIRARVETDFANTPVRPGYLAGQSYPADPGELSASLEAFFPQTAESGAGPAAPLRALIVPHIDFQRGGPTYGHGYQRMRQGGKPDTAIIFGVAHALAPVPFTLTKKHFQTPFGALETAPDLVDRLAAACAWDPYEHEIVHRTEHSIEFQAVMLAHLYGTGVRIVPILCGPLTDDPHGIHPAAGR